MIMIRDKRGMTVLWSVAGPFLGLAAVAIALGFYILWKKVFSSRY